MQIIYNSVQAMLKRATSDSMKYSNTKKSVLVPYLLRQFSLLHEFFFGFGHFEISERKAKALMKQAFETYEAFRNTDAIAGNYSL